MTSLIEKVEKRLVDLCPDIADSMVCHPNDLARAAIAEVATYIREIRPTASTKPDWLDRLLEDCEIHE